MELTKEIQEGLNNASQYVISGIDQIVSGDLDEYHSVSPSPGATSLAALALLALGRGFENTQQKALNWLRNNYREGWGKTPGDQPDEEITQIARAALSGSQVGWWGKILLLAQARQFSQMILSLGQRMVPGLEGPTPEEIVLPTILEDRVLTKLPLYGRPVVVAASLLCAESQESMKKGVQYLLDTQLKDGSWSEDIIATSLAILAIMRTGGNSKRLEKAGQWLVRKQYPSGGWPAFDQLNIWAVGWALCIYGESKQGQNDISWLNRAVNWLKQGQNEDGSYGSTPPFTHPDLDDTAVALIGLHQVGQENPSSLKLLKNLQNTDGSWGTFPSFQGRPPQISSDFPVYIPSVDVSIHALEALWQRSRSQEARIWQGLNWILAQQDDQGAFPASWYEGPIYSTAQAIELLSKWKFSWERWKSAHQILKARKKSLEFLIQAQNKDGGWGSVVETGLAVSGLMRYAGAVPKDVLDRGIYNLLITQKNNGSFEPSYRAIYAKGWNYEEPITTALTAIRAFQRYNQIYQASYGKSRKSF